MKPQSKSLIIWLVLLVALLALANFVNVSQQTTQVSYAKFLEQVDKEWHVLKNTTLEIEGHKHHVDITYELDGKRYQVQGPSSDTLYGTLADKGLEFSYDAAGDGSSWQLLVLGVPLVLVVLIMFVFMRQMQNGGGKAMSFGKSRARLLNEQGGRITFKDVAGIDEARGEIEEIIDFLRDTRKYLRVGGRIPKGVLLMGPPGTGKTLLARAIAGEAGVAFFSISGSDFVEMFVGVGASRVRDLFEQGKKNAPCIIFIDEIDAVGRHRGAGLGGGHDEREQTLNQLLVEMDGFESNEGVILIAATNRPDVLDPALLRPGRFDRRITVGLPDVTGRAAILDVHTRKVPLDGDVALERLARGTPGFSGADLENLVNEAALMAARDGRDKVAEYDLESAKDKVLMGAERRSMALSQREKRTTAWHEAGHALVAMLLPPELVDEVHRVTIIPRGQALGVTQQLPSEDRYSIDRERALARIAIALGGRLAEELALGGQQTSGAGNDIEHATALARHMVCEWGMSDRLGPISYRSSESEPFLGRDIQRPPAYSEATAQAIDREVHDIVTAQYERAKKLLSDNRDALERLTDALMERETIGTEEVKAAIEGKALPPKPARPTPGVQAGSVVASEAPADDVESAPTASGFPMADPA